MFTLVCLSGKFWEWGTIHNLVDLTVGFLFISKDLFILDKNAPQGKLISEGRIGNSCLLYTLTVNCDPWLMCCLVLNYWRWNVLKPNFKFIFMFLNLFRILIKFIWLVIYCLAGIYPIIWKTRAVSLNRGQNCLFAFS